MYRWLRPTIKASSLVIASLSIVGVHATTADDLVNLQIACADASNVINASLNNSAALNTSTLVQNIGYEVGASQMNLAISNETTTPRPLNQNATYPLDDLYFQYGSSLNTFGEALLRRGQAPHDEADAPVFLAIQGLGAAVEVYALQLRDYSLVSEAAFIFALAVENDLVQATSAWAGFASPMAPGTNLTAARSRRSVRRRA